MKKLLLGSVAVIGLGAVAMSSPALAGEGVKLGAGGFYKGYINYSDQDEATGVEVRSLDILQESEVHLSGETTLDNGLTVGAMIEIDLDSDHDVEENYVYFSGSWGRAQIGAEDGAAKLLQVVAPSADSNIDGFITDVNPVNFGAFTGTGDEEVSVDYDMDVSGKLAKVTYLSPVFSGFQVGASYTPEVGGINDKSGNHLDGEAYDLTVGEEEGSYGDVFDLGFRYEGEFDEVGVAFGAGWSQAELEEAAAEADVVVGMTTDDVTEWYVGLDLDWAAFGLGISYGENDNGEVATVAASNANTVDEEETLVVGIDYTTGPFKLGASYYDADNFDGVQDQDLKRYSAGVVYTYGPGMTFRGSVHMLDLDDGTTDYDSTNLLLGTQIKF